MNKSLNSSFNANSSANYNAFLKAICTKPELFVSGLGKNIKGSRRVPEPSNPFKFAKGHRPSDVRKDNKKQFNHNKKYKNFNHLKRTEYVTQSIFSAYNKLTLPGTFISDVERVVAPVGELTDLLKSAPVQMALNNLDVIRNKGVDVKHTVGVSNEALFIMAILILIGGLHTKSSTLKIVGSLGSILMSFKLLKPSGLENIFEYIFNMIKESVRGSGNVVGQSVRDEVDLHPLRMPNVEPNAGLFGYSGFFTEQAKERHDQRHGEEYDLISEYTTQAVEISVLFRAIVVAMSSFSIWKNYGTVGVSSINKINDFARTLTPITQIFKSGEDILTSVLHFFEYIINMIGKWFKDDFRFAFGGEIWYELEIIRNKLKELKESFDSKEDLGDVARRARSLKTDLQGMRAPKEGQAYVQYRDLCNQVGVLVDDLARFGAVGNDMRIEPFVVILSGPPGVGKSIVSKHILDMMAHEILKTPKAFQEYEQCPGTYIFNPNQEEKYVSGYTNQPFVVLDDLGYSPDSIKTAVPRFIQMVNTMPYMLEQAELHRKGNIFFDSKFILASSNVCNWAQAADTLQNKDALCRRFHVTINISCKPQFATEETKCDMHPQLDINKITNTLDGDWLQIEVYDPTGRRPHRKMCHHGLKCPHDAFGCRDANMNDLIRIVILTYRERLERQKHFQSAAKDKLKLMSTFQGDTLELIEAIHAKKPVLPTKDDEVIDLTPVKSNYVQSSCMGACVLCKKDELGSKQDIDLFINARINEILVDLKENLTCSGSCCHNLMSYEFMDTVVEGMEPIDYCCLLEYIDERSKWSNDPKCCLIEYEYLKRMLVAKKPEVGKPTRIIAAIRYCSDRVKVAMSKLFDFADSSFFEKVKEFIQSPMGIGLISTGILTLLGMGLYNALSNEVADVKKRTTWLHKHTNRHIDNISDDTLMIVERLDTLGVGAPDINDREDMDALHEYVIQGVDVNALDIMRTLASNNVMHMYKNGSYYTTVFGIGAEVVLMNKHVVDRLIYLGECDLILTRQGKQSTQWTFKCKSTHIDFTRVLEYPDQDLLAVQIKGLSCKEVEHLTHDDNITYRTASQLGVAWFDPHNVDHSYNCFLGPSLQPLVHKTEKPMEARDNLMKKLYVTTNYVRYDIPTTTGMCGAPVVAMDKTRLQKLVAIHCGGNGANGYGVRLTNRMVKDAKAFFNTYTVQYNVSGMSKENVFFDQCPTKSIEGCQVIGKVTPVQTTLKSEIEKSPLYGNVKGHPPNLMPAILVPQTLDGKLTCPIEKNLEGYARGMIVPDPIILEGVTRSYIKDLKKSKPPRRVNFLTFEESVQGSPDLPFVKSINRGTSGGYPDKLYMKKKKRSAFGEGDEFTFDTPEAILQRKTFDEAMLALKDGPIEMIANIFPKDELRPKLKAKALKTRLIAGFSCSATLVIRSIFGPMIDWMSSDANRVNNSSAVGVNPASGDWHQIAMKLGFGDPDIAVKAGDYSSFDKCLNPFIMEKVFEIWKEFFGVYLTEEENTIARNCWISITNVLVVCKDNLIYWGNSNPSGNPLTTLINTICNIILLRYGITDVLTRELDEKIRTVAYIMKLWREISDDINIVCFGDDNMFSHRLNSPVLSVLPPLTYEAIGASLLKIGFTYTDEAKSSIYNEAQRTVFDVGFLKRFFVKEAGKVMAPLDLETIMQKIQWKKKSDKDNSLFCEKFENFIAELSAHEKSIFDKNSKILFDALESALPNHDVERSLSQDQWRTMWSKKVETY